MRSSSEVMPWCAAALAVCVVGASGCFIRPTSQAEPDSEPIALVARDIYDRLAEPSRVYVGGDESLDRTLARVRAGLAAEFASEFRSPEDRLDGVPGASIALGRFRLLDPNHVKVSATFVTEDSSDRGCIEYTLEREGNSWQVAESVDAASGCLVTDYGTESYHDTLARARSGECSRLGTGIGTCGPWLYAVESNGYGGTRSYFDWQTGLMVARQQFSDAEEVADLFVFGHVDCEPTVIEAIPCNE